MRARKEAAQSREEEMGALEEMASEDPIAKETVGHEEDQLGAVLTAKSAEVTSILADVKNGKIRAEKDDVVENEELEAWLQSNGKKMPPWRKKKWTDGEDPRSLKKTPKTVSVQDEYKSVHGRVEQFMAALPTECHSEQEESALQNEGDALATELRRLGHMEEAEQLNDLVDSVVHQRLPASEGTESSVEYDYADL